MPAAFSTTLLRHVAVVASLITLWNTLRQLVRPGLSLAEALFLVPGSPWLSELALLSLSAALLLVAFSRSRAPRAVGMALLGALVSLSLYDAWLVLRLRASGALSHAFPVPFSLCVASALSALIALAVASSRAPVGIPTRRQHAASAALIAAAGFTSLLLYIHSYGLTDYRRPGDAILVLGAKVHRDGTPSEALAERVETGVSLYQQGLAPVLVMSGGVGREGHDEAVVMKAMAEKAGVPADAIWVDSLGNNTEASVRNLRERLARRDAQVLAVSHYHHLPRIKLLSAMHGLRVVTVPADEGETRLRGTPLYVVKEAAALAYYYLRG